MASRVKQISFVLVCLYALLQAVAGETNEVPCVCVWDFQCTNGTLNRYGLEILKPRSSKSSKSNCNSDLGLVCCPINNIAISETSYSIDEESTTPPSRENESDFEGEETPNGTNQPSNDASSSGLYKVLGFGGLVPNRSISSGSDPSSPYPSASYQSAPQISPPYMIRPDRLIPESSSHKASDPSPPNPSSPPKETNQNIAHTFVVNEDPPRPKANAFIVPKSGCGVKRTELIKKISFTSLDESIGSFAEFPWMLAVFSYRSSTSWKFECGASLIHKEVALTAAHCVSNFPVTSLRIRAGEWNIKTTEEPEPHQDRKARRVEIHPLYRRHDLRHDIALIFFDSPFNTGRSVDTICLPPLDSLFHNSRCTVTGWGKDANNFQVMHHDILHKLEVPVIPRDECERRLSESRHRPTRVHYSFLCAGGEVGKDACKGDGGGPLICPTDEENRWVQAGIVSSGYGCGTSDPAFYTDVSLHVDWIDRYLREIEHIRTDPYSASSIPHRYQPATQLY